MLEKDIDGDPRNSRHQAIGYFSRLTEELCLKLSNSLDMLKVSGVEREKLIINLNFVAAKDIKAAEHSIRLALLSSKLRACTRELPSPRLIYDIKQSKLPATALKKTYNISEKSKYNKHQAEDYFSELKEKLCIKLNNSFDMLKIYGVEREKLIINLNYLSAKDVKTAEHSMRVALLCEQIGYELKVDAKGLFYSGLIHDIGKALVPSEILKKTDNFDKNDMEIMKEHPLNTLKLVGDIFGFSAEVALRHHKHQTNGYPLYLPPSKYPFSDNTITNIDYYSKILSIADSFDAAVSRKGSKYGKDRPLTLEEAFERIMGNSPDDKDLISNLSNSTAFRRHMELIKY